MVELESVRKCVKLTQNDPPEKKPFADVAQFSENKHAVKYYLYIHSKYTRSASKCHQIQLRIIRNSTSFTWKPMFHALQNTSNCIMHTSQVCFNVFFHIHFSASSARAAYISILSLLWHCTTNMFTLIYIFARQLYNTICCT